MRKTFLIIVCLLFASIINAQCNIYCKEVDNKKKETMVGFKLYLEPQNGKQPILISSNNGSLYINRTDFANLRNRRIVGFQFLNPLDHERYSMPYELKVKSFVLAQLCGRTLMVDFLW